jgi:GT2 family glycosyltransferase
VADDASLESVDIIIKTFMRGACLRRLVASILDRYPRAHLNIADDSDPDADTREYYAGLEAQGHQVLVLPFNVGISAGRNALVARTTRPFLLFLDDDFVFTERTRIETMVEVMCSDPAIGVVGGSLLDFGTDLRSYEFTMEIAGRLGHSYPIGPPTQTIAGHRCRDSQIVLNFALFRREVFDDVQWDESLKTLEHKDFYLRLRSTPWRVVHVPDVVADHFPEKPTEYLPFRENEANDRRVLRKWRIGGWVEHDDDPVRDRRRVRRAYARAALTSLRRGQLVMAAGLAVSEAAGEVRRRWAPRPTT